MASVAKACRSLLSTGPGIGDTRLVVEVDYGAGVVWVDGRRVAERLRGETTLTLHDDQLQLVQLTKAAVQAAMLEQ